MSGLTQLVNFYHSSASSVNTTLGGTDHVRLVAINIGTGAASAVVTVKAGGSAGNTVTVIDASAKGTYWFGGVRCPGGLYVATAGGAADVTVSYI